MCGSGLEEKDGTEGGGTLRGPRGPKIYLPMKNLGFYFLKTFCRLKTCPKIAHTCGHVTTGLLTGPYTVVHVQFALKLGEELRHTPGSLANDWSMGMVAIVNPIVLLKIEIVTEPKVRANRALVFGVPLA